MLNEVYLVGKFRVIEKVLNEANQLTTFMNIEVERTKIKEDNVLFDFINIKLPDLLVRIVESKDFNILVGVRAHIETSLDEIFIVADKLTFLEEPKDAE